MATLRLLLPMALALGILGMLRGVRAEEGQQGYLPVVQARYCTGGGGYWHADVYFDGRVREHSWNAKEGRVAWRLKPEARDRLLNAIHQVGFFHLKDRYEVRGIFDLPSYSLEVRRGSRHKRVVVYGVPREGFFRLWDRVTAELDPPDLTLRFKTC
ncbi:MAG: hypothetical protein AB1758_19655 [Candidatus Eremiobacterota bacterium]